MTIVVLSWHPPGGMVTAGGFRRGAEVVRRLSRLASVVAVDTDPSMYGTDGIELREYVVPPLGWTSRIHRACPRIGQWAVALWCMTVLGTKAARRAKRVVVYVPSSEIPLCALAAVIVKWLSGSAVVLSNHNLPGRGFRWAMRVLHNAADAITTSSKELHDGLRRLGVTTAISVTRNGPTWPIRSIEQRELALSWDGVFVGRHTLEKGIMDLLEVWEQIAQVEPQRRLLSIGASSPWMNPVIEERIERSPLLAATVTISGVVSDDEKFAALRRARVLLAPSHVEGWGFVPLEALACGVPVVCWDLDVYDESLPACAGVIRVPTGDIPGFSAAVLRLFALSDEERAALVQDFHEPDISWQDVAAAEFGVMSAALEARAGLP